MIGTDEWLDMTKNHDWGMIWDGEKWEMTKNHAEGVAMSIINTKWIKEKLELDQGEYQIVFEADGKYYYYDFVQVKPVLNHEEAVVIMLKGGDE